MANKMKTHKATAKVLKVRKGGSIKYQPANKLHRTAGRSNASRRRRHHESSLHKSDLKRIKTMINK